MAEAQKMRTPANDFPRFIQQYQGSTQTKKLYGESLELFGKFLGKADPTERSVEDFLMVLQNRKMASASIARHLSAIRAYFLWRKKRSAPAERGNWDIVVKGPKIHHKMPRVTHSDEILRILNACHTPYERALIMTAYDPAFRMSDLVSIQIEDVDYQSRFIKVLGKGGDEYNVPVGVKTLAAIRDYAGSRHGPLFNEPAWRLGHDMRRVSKHAGIKGITPHQFRHARAQELRRQGIQVQDAQKLLRHKNIQTTMIYFAAEDTDLQKKLPPAF